MVTMMGRVTAHNVRHLCKTPVITEQYIREQMVRGTGHLEGIFTDTNSIEALWVFNTYTAGTQVNTYHSVRQDKTPDQQIKVLACLI